MPSPNIVIDARDVTLSLGENSARVDILRGISLSVSAGSSVALLGASGSGKSSLMAVLSGLERASGGSIHVAGADFSAMDEDDLARARRGRIGIVLQAFHLLPTMTALENVAVPLELSGVEAAFDRAAEELNSVGLGARLGHYPAQLSGGEQQRVAIARTLMQKPRLILADEPVASLDPKLAETVLDILKRVSQEDGITTLVSLHTLEMTRRYSDRVIGLAQGEVAFDDSPENLSEQVVANIYERFTRQASK